MRAGLGPCVANEATGRSCQARFVWDRGRPDANAVRPCVLQAFPVHSPTKSALRGRTLVLPGAGDGERSLGRQKRKPGRKHAPASSRQEPAGTFSSLLAPSDVRR